MKIQIQNNYFKYADGRPFFYLADTAWELFHRLTHDEIDFYLNQRAKQGFNVVNAVALAEFEGLSVPNANGRLPLKLVNGQYCPVSPDTDGSGHYWETVDYAIKKAEELGMFIGLLPSWGDKWNKKWGVGPEIFTPENARAYGQWIGKRYGSYENIIWIVGGDRPIETPTHQAIIDEMAAGLRDTEAFYHLMSFHPPGGTSSADFVLGRPYIDFHMIQSGHDADGGYKSWQMLKDTFAKENKPFLNGEPRYEDHPCCFKVEYNYLWDAADTRMNLYWDIFEGTCGHTYGNHCIWSFNRELADYFPVRWRDALTHEGAETMRYAKQLRESRDYFSLKPAPQLADDNGGVMHIACAIGDGYGYVYSPLGAPINVHLSAMGCNTIKASWFNPRNGQTQVFMVLPGSGCALLVPPSGGKGNDWVLVLDRLD